MTNYEKGYTAAKAGRNPAPPATGPSRGCYMDGYRDAERGVEPNPEWVAWGWSLTLGDDGKPYDPSSGDDGPRSVGKW